MTKILNAALACAILCGQSFSQSSINPDISIIPDFRTFTTTEKGAAERNKLNFTLQEVEMAVQAPLNPYARADIFIAFSPDKNAPVDIEEAYFLIQKGLPLNLNIKGGKFLVDFSKLNTVHAHTFPFVHRPRYQQNFFGEEGLTDIGVEINSILPTGDVFTKISGTITAGDDLDGRRKNLFYASRLSSFFQLTDLAALETGVGAATGFSDTTGKHFQWFNADAKYKWRKDQYTSLTLWTEGFLSSANHVRTFGFYTAGAYQFKKRFEIGSKFDMAQSIANKNKTRILSCNFNFLPAEETMVFRLVVSNTKRDHQSSFNTILLQTIWSLGPHKAHAF